MKRIPLWLFVFLMPCLSVFAQQTRDQAIEYNNYIIKEQNKLINKGLEYMSFVVHSENYDEIEKQRQDLINQIYASIRKIRKMPAFNSSNRLKNVTLDVFYNYLDIYQTDLIEVMGLKKKYKDDYAALEAYMKAEAQLDIKLSKSVEKLTEAQENFARQNDLKVNKNGSGSDQEFKVLEISRLSTYTRLVFLEYFHVSWKFNDMINILHLRDAKLLAKKREDVIESAQQALLNLKTMTRFDNDEVYIGQAIEIVQYFHNLAFNDFLKVERLFAKDSLSSDEAAYINQLFKDYNFTIQTMMYNWELSNMDLWKNHVKEVQ